ncbi:MAG: hypothetical protein JXR94_16480, partial [Candidatus Hydrogenedentes bacterium]|nr:hypothetical protein [Candidatus Hydrogenedentota bacterium]
MDGSELGWLQAVWTSASPGLAVIAAVALAAVPALVAGAAEDDLDWHDIRQFGIEGQGWPDVDQPFDRFPARAHGVVREPVWSLSLHTAGLCVRFVTDAPSITARWTVRNGRLDMDHMPATGVSGLDLYVKDGFEWRWLGVGRPQSSPTNQKELAGGIPEGRHQYLLYLPLYN